METKKLTTYRANDRNIRLERDHAGLDFTNISTAFKMQITKSIIF